MTVAVVTGASRGIGRAIVSELARDGYNIVGIARDARQLDEVAADVREHGVDFLPLAIDLTTTAGPSEASEQAWAWRGGVVALVNAAGVIVRSPAEQEMADAWDRTMRLNAQTPHFLMEWLGRRMARNAGGVIVNVASIAGEVVTQAPAAYQASKAALGQLTRYYAVELAPTVRVNAVAPGYIRTDLNEAWLANPANEGYVNERTPLGRVGVPSDVAAAVKFLVSAGAGYITGQTLLIDGGWTAT